MKVCCYEDTGSCSVAFTRLYTGRVNGLFGESDPPKREAVEKCYQVFGEHKRAQFRKSLEVTFSFLSANFR
jgi:hypothetical protein